MRKVTLKDIKNVKALLATAKTDKIGSELAELLREVLPEDYRGISVITDRQTLVEPVLRDGSIFLLDKESGRYVDIDSLDPQFRWDTVSCLWNVLQSNTEEIEDL